MPQAVITINAVVGSDDDLPIGTVVQLNNQNSGGESTFFWEIVSQPSGTADTLSSASIQNPTFTPNKEGSYLLRLTVNQSLPTEQQDQVIAAVRQLKTRIRVPATGETDENGTEGWAEPNAADAVLQLVDAMRADPGIEVCVVNDAAVVANSVVKFDSVQTIKAGLPGEEDLLGVAVVNALTPVAGPVGFVIAEVDGGAIGVNSLVYVRRFGIQTTQLIGAAVVGQPAYLGDTGLVSNAPGTTSRQVGVFVANGLSTVVYFDGAQQTSAGGAPVTLQSAYTAGPTITKALGVPVAINDATAGTAAALTVACSSLTHTGPAVLASVASASPVAVVKVGDLGGYKMELWADGIHGNSALNVSPSTPAGVGSGGLQLTVAGGSGSAGDGVTVGGLGADLLLDAGNAGPNGGAGAGTPGIVKIATAHATAQIASGVNGSNLLWQHLGNLALALESTPGPFFDYDSAIQLQEQIGAYNQADLFHTEGTPEDNIPANPGSLALVAGSVASDADGLYVKRSSPTADTGWVRLDGSINTFLTGSHNNVTPSVIGAIYIPTARVLSAASRGCIQLSGGAGLSGYMDITPLNTLVAAATFLTVINLAPGYYDAPIATGAGTTIAAGWYHIRIASLTGGQCNGEALYLVV